MGPSGAPRKSVVSEEIRFGEEGNKDFMDNMCPGEVVNDKNKHTLAIYKEIKHAFQVGNVKGDIS